MTDKDLIKKNFEKHIDDYNTNAIAQKQMAKKLVSMLFEKKYSKILEIGSYSGILTSEISKNIKYESYSAIDVVQASQNYISKIDKNIKFINKDIEEFETTEKFDLIISNASLQWCDDFENTIKRIKSYLNTNGTIAISIFSQDNLKEIKSVFGVSLDYPAIDKLERIFSPNAKLETEKIVLHFSSPLEILRHLKYTGVNSITKTSYTYKTIKTKLSELNEQYSNSLTYSPVYIVETSF